MSDNSHSQINWRSRIVKYGKVHASELCPHPDNPRTHPQIQRDAVAASFDELGQIAPILINVNNGYIVDGVERSWLALAQPGDVEVDAIWLDLTEEEHQRALLIFDPITSLATYDTQKLDALLRDVNTDSPALQSMLSELATANGLYQNGNESPGDPGAAIDRAEALQQKYGVERPQIWQVGRHRVMCGDSYNHEHIALLLDGTKPDMLHTDPPYGINIVRPRNGGSAAAIGGAKPFGSTAPADRKGKAAVAERNSGKVGGGRGDLLRRPVNGARGDVGRVAPPNIVQSNLYPVIEGDDTPFGPTLFVDFAPIVIMWGANYYADKLPSKACWIVWDKRENITRNNFADCELAWTNQDSPARIFYHLWNGLHKGSQNGERRTHPTEKPVALFEEIGKMYADGGVWLDLFAGTGAQIVAAERSGATCYALEYEPLYVATILERMAGMGLEPRLVS